MDLGFDLLYFLLVIKHLTNSPFSLSFSFSLSLPHSLSQQACLRLRPRDQGVNSGTGEATDLLPPEPGEHLHPHGPTIP